MANKKISIEGRVAFVSGSNRGIGKAITVALLENGAKKVYAGARDVSSLDELVSQFGERITTVSLDVTDDTSIAEAAKTVPYTEILVNNAGIFSGGNFLNGNLLESLKANMDVNVWGLVKLTDAFLGTLRKQEAAAIVNILSMVGLASMPMGLTYSASKATAHSITQGLRGELKDSNILVSGVYPGPIDTDMTRGLQAEKDSPENVAKNIIQGIEKSEEYIFPDVMSKQVGAEYLTSPKTIEEQFANWV